MNDRRKALLGRFRAGSLERIRKLTLKLLELEAGGGTGADAEEIARELHTLKGESRMLDLGDISEVAHGAEALLAAGGDQHYARVMAALDVVSRSLRGEYPNERESRAALAEARLKLAVSAPGSEGLPVAAVQGEPQEAEPARTEATGVAERWIQVNARQVDEVSYRLGQFNSDFRALNARLRSFRSVDMSTELRTLVEDFDRCRAQLDDLTGASWALRLVPVEPAFVELLQHARQLAAAQGKRLRVSIEAAGAQVERTVLDALREPLVHLVSNAVDHGIEPPNERGAKPAEASLKLRAEPIGANVVLSIGDDGRGIDPERVRAAAVARGLMAADAALPDDEVIGLVFRHGFSTRSEVTQISGRGVGLDVVRSAVERVGGTVSLHSEPGRGTQISLSIPARISQERALVVDCGGSLFAIPSRHVLEVVRSADHPVERVAGGQILQYRDGPIPVRSLSQVLARREAQEPWVIILHVNNRTWAFTAPALLGEHELVRHPLDPMLAAIDYLGASATLDDGRLVLLVATLGLLRQAELKNLDLQPAAQAPKRRARVLVVDDSEVIRDLVAQVLRASGLEVSVAPEGKTALEQIEANPPDLVVADVEMPLMDGFELLRRIRLRSQHLPVVLLTSRGSAEDRRQAVALGANGHLIKSGFQESTLLETVRRFVDLTQ